jgi:cellobiose phosphorylase
MYRLGVEAVLGLRPSGGGFRIDPCIPPEWSGFEATLRRNGSEYRIRVENPAGGSSAVEEVRVDGRAVAPGVLDMEPGRHDVVVRLGADPHP